jgi:hypothetical protein
MRVTLIITRDGVYFHLRSNSFWLVHNCSIEGRVAADI